MTQPPPTESSPPPHKKRRWPKVLLILFVLLILLIALAPTLLSTPPGRAFILGQVNSRISGTTQADSLSLGWFSGIAATNLKLLDPDGKPVLTVPSLTTGLSLLGALSKKPDLGQTQIDQAAVNFVAYADGTSNLSRTLAGKSAAPSATEPTAAPASSPPAASADANPFPFFGSITAKDTTISYQAPGSDPTQLSIPTTALVIDPSSGSLKLTVDGKLVKGPIPPATISATLTAALDNASQLVTLLDDCTLAEKDATTGVGTSVVIKKNSKLSWGAANSDLTITTIYDLARLQSLLKPFLPADLQMQGHNVITLHISGALADGAGAQRFRKMTLDPTTLAYDHIAFQGYDFSKNVLPLALKDGILTFNNGSIPTNNGQIILAGTVDINGPTPVYTLKVSSNVVQNFAINSKVGAGALSFLPLMWGANGNTNLAAVTGQLQVKLDQANLALSRAGLNTGTVSGVLSIQKLSTDTPLFDAIGQALGPVLHTGSGAFKISNNDITVPFSLANGRVSYKDLKLTIGTIGIDMSGSVGVDQTIDMTVNITAADINVPLPLTIKGTTSKPEVKLDPSAIGKSLESESGIEGLFKKKKK